MTSVPGGTQPFADARPGWRRGHVGWSLLHFVIGLAIWFGALFAIGIAFAIDGRADSDIDRIPGWVALPPLIGGVVGWLCFAYLKTSLARRWIVFGGLVGVTYVIAIWSALASTG